MKMTSLAALLYLVLESGAGLAQQPRSVLNLDPSLAREYNNRAHDPPRDRTKSLREKYQAIAARQGGVLTREQAEEFLRRYAAIAAPR